MNNNLKKKIKDKARMRIINETTHNIGKIEIKDNEIYCYVDLDKFKKKNGYFPDDITLYGFLEHKWGKELLEMYDLDDKKINYIISGAFFNAGLEIRSYGKCCLLFENCKFKTFIEITHGDEFIFKNNEYIATEFPIVDMYKNKFYMYTGDIYTGSVDEINSIKFINDKVKIDSDFPTRIGEHVFRKPNIESRLELVAKNVEFVNTSFSDISDINIRCNNLLMRNSGVEAQEMEITADKIDNDGSNIIMVENAIIEDKNEDYNIVSDIWYDILFFNGVQLSNNMDDSLVDKNSYELQKERVNLVDALRLVYNKCNNDIDEKTEEIRNDMKQNSIGRVLKK